MSYAILPARSVLRVSGSDASEFLQGIVSNDVRRLADVPAIYAAMLTPQGKFLHDFFLVADGDAILIDCASARTEDLYKRLSFYKLRADVTIEKRDDLRVAALWGNGPVPGAPWFADPRMAALGWRLIDGMPEVKAEAATPEAYDRMRLALGVPDGAQDMIADKSLLLEFGFEDLHGVDFSKGCYVGQEVTARSKYRGQVRRFAYRVQGGADLPEPGAPVYRDGAAAGELRSSCGDSGIALLRVEEVQKPGEFRCGDTVLTVTLPPWAAHPPSLAEEAK